MLSIDHAQTTAAGRWRVWTALVAAVALVFAGVGVSASASGTAEVSGSIQVEGALPETVASIQIVDADNNLVESPSVTIGTGLTHWSAHIPEGTYAFGLIAPGTGIETWYAGQATQDDADRVTIGAAGNRGLDFDTIYSTGSIVSGTLTDADGSPVEGAEISLGGVRSTFSAADGAFTLVNVPVGTYELRYTLEDFTAGSLPSAIEIPADGTVVDDVKLAVGALYFISGTIVDGAGDPLPGVDVSFAADGVNLSTAPTQADGTYLAGPLAPGTYDVSVGDHSTTVTITDADLAGVDFTVGEPTEPTPILTGPTPTISDTTPQVGQRLSVKVGAWTAGAKLSHRWLRGSTVVGTSPTYTVAAGDLGQTLKIEVTGKLDGQTLTKLSAETKAVARGALTAATPTISGTAQVGRELTAKPGVWTSGTAFAYQWFAGGKAISKATKSTFTLTAAQLDKTITVKVTGAKSGYTTASKTSKASAKVKAAKLTSTPTPTISGTTKVARTLTAKAGTFKPTGGKVTYQWYRGSAKISKATKPTYKLVKADKGKKVTVKVTYAKSGYTTATTSSKATATIK